MPRARGGSSQEAEAGESLLGLRSVYTMRLCFKNKVIALKYCYLLNKSDVSWENKTHIFCNCHCPVHRRSSAHIMAILAFLESLQSQHSWSMVWFNNQSNYSHEMPSSLGRGQPLSVSACTIISFWLHVGPEFQAPCITLSSLLKTCVCVCTGAHELKWRPKVNLEYRSTGAIHPVFSHVAITGLGFAGYVRVSGH